MQNANATKNSNMTKDPQTVDAVQGNQASDLKSSNTNIAQMDDDTLFFDNNQSDSEASEVESFVIDQDDLDDDDDTSRFLLSRENLDQDGDIGTVDPETHARLEALLEAAGLGKLSTADGKAFADPEVLRRLTSSVSCALDEAAAALTRMRAEQQADGAAAPADSKKTLAQACSSGDIGTVRQLLHEGRSVHETTEEGESLLSLACSAGYYELAQVLLAMRANVEDRGIKGDCTPLMEAASGGYVEIVKLLITHGAEVNAQSSAGNTPLHYAACGGHEAVVQVLIDTRANVEEHNENGHTPLMEAASAGHVGVAKLLLDSGAGINTHSNEFKESALTLACYKGHLEMVQFLLDAGADHEHKTDEMHTALMEACMDGHVEVARLLLDKGAHVNMPIDSFESPLTLAACGGHVELANLLIERHANLEEVNDEGYTPLMEASREGHEEMVALLLAHGADINGQTEETQETALTLACCGGFQEVADFLIKAGADLEQGCSTPLMEAAQEGHLELVKYLIKAKANVHQQTQTGDTALTYACENGHTDVAEVLLEAGAALEHESEGGRTPLMKAARAGHQCTVQFLIGRGADVNRATSTNDHTVLSLACAGGHLPVVELLLRHGADSGHKLKDGSTMLIEAAKGGHTTVVNLLLDWPSSLMSPTAELNATTLSPPQTSLDMNQLPRVPIHGLPNFVPPQDPNKAAGSAGGMAQVPCSTQQQAQALVQQVQASVQYTQPSATSAVPGEVNLSDLNIQRHSWEQIKENMKASLAQKKRGGSSAGVAKVKAAAAALEASGWTREGSASGDTGQQELIFSDATAEALLNNATAKNDINIATSAAGQMASDHLGADLELSFADGGSPVTLNLESRHDMKASERLEQFINKMMQKAELLNTTREEQILKKQQILEELQKVGNLLLDSVPKTSSSKHRERSIGAQNIIKSENSSGPTSPQRWRSGSDLDVATLSIDAVQTLLDAANVEQELQEKAKLHMMLNTQQKLETERLYKKQQQLQDMERRMQGGGAEGGKEGDTGASSPPLLRTHNFSTDSESGAFEEEVPKPPSEVSSLDQDADADELVYVYADDVSEDNYDDDEDDDLMTDEVLAQQFGMVGFLPEGLTKEQVRECQERLNEAVRQNSSTPLTCVPNPMPLHIALTSDLQHHVQLGLSSIAASLPSRSSEITKMTNEASALVLNATNDNGGTAMLVNGPVGGDEEDDEPRPIQDNTVITFQGTIEEQTDNATRGAGDEASRPQLAKQESLSSVNSDVEEVGEAITCDQALLAAQAQVMAAARLSGDRIMLADGTLVDLTPLPYFTPPEGSPERTGSNQSADANAMNAIPLPPMTSAQSSRASSEEVDLSNVMPVVEMQPVEDDGGDKSKQLSQQLQLLQQQLQQHQLLQQRLAIAKDRRLAAAVNAVVTNGGMHAGNATSVIVANPQQLQGATGLATKLMIPVQLEALTPQAITSANAAAIQKQLEQQRQQLQAQLVLQQQLQHELQQQLKLQQEHEQLKQQLEAHQAQVALQQKQLQAQTNKMKGNQAKIQQASLNISSTTTTLESLQQEINQQELQHLKLQQVQQHLQQLHQQLQQVQQLQNNHQLTQQELLQQAQHLHQQLQAAQLQQFAVQGQPLHTAQVAVQTTGIVSQPLQVNQQMAHLLSQPDLLQQAQHLAVVQRQQNALQQQAVAAQAAQSGAASFASAASAAAASVTGAPRSGSAAMVSSHTAISAVSTLPISASTVQATNIIQANITNVNVNNAVPQSSPQLQAQTSQSALASHQPSVVKKAKKKHNLFTQQHQLQTAVAAPLDAAQQQQQLQQQHQLQQLQALQQQQLHQQYQQQQQLYQLQQQQYQQQFGHQHPQLLNNAALAQQIPDYSNLGAHNTGIPPSQLYNYYLDLVNQPAVAPVTPNPSPASPQVSPPVYPSVELDAQTESNHDTALTLACAGGHAELVNLLLSRGAEIEHRDKKGFTPLILASTAGHTEIVETLLDHGADIEAQSERTKDTPLSLACSGGRYEVVDLLLQRGANKEHRNVSDYTPLSLAASGGYVNIIKLLLSYNAEINSRTGSKLGISPLMLAAMNGHTAAVKLLLDMGSDINAQIETNRNTALTLACFQGRHEVVSLLVDRKANIEHRAKTGLTPLMEAASGGYVEVGRVLLDKGADVNASPVPSSKDTALTIAADKGHFRFVELLINKHAAIDVRNKKGNSPLWLACNGGHLDVAQLLVNAKADVDSQDNRKVSCLMAAFRKGHIKCVKWMVKHVTQFPSDQDCMRFIQTVTDKELLKKCHQCMEIIVSAKDRQAAEANKNASILLEEIESERSREETKRERAARKREKRRQKKKEKAEKERSEKEEKEREEQESEDIKEEEELEADHVTKASGDKAVKKSKSSRSESPASVDSSGLPDMCRTQLLETTQSLSTLEIAAKPQPPANNNNKNKKKKKGSKSHQSAVTSTTENSSSSTNKSDSLPDTLSNINEKYTTTTSNKASSSVPAAEKSRSSASVNNIVENTVKSVPKGTSAAVTPNTKLSSSATKGNSAMTAAEKKVIERNNTKNIAQSSAITHSKSNKKVISDISSTTGIGDLDDFGALPGQMTELRINSNGKKESSQHAHERKNAKTQKKIHSLDNLDPLTPMKSGLKVANTPSPKKGGSKREQEEWKEVIRRSKKISVPSNSVTRVIGRQGVNINAIKEVSGANIEIDRARSGDRTLTIKGSAEATKRAHDLLSALIKDPDKEVEQLLPKLKASKTPQVVNTNTLTMSSNVWHNSMANALGNNQPTSQATTGQQSGKVTAATAARVTAVSTVAVTTNASRPAASKSTMNHFGTFQVTNGTAIWGNPGQPPRHMQNQALLANASTAEVNYTPEKSPSVVSRKLFTNENNKDPSQAQSAAQLQATYSSPSMAKTKLVDTTQPAFSTKENNMNIATNGKNAVGFGNARPQRAPVAPISRPTPTNPPTLAAPRSNVRNDLLQDKASPRPLGQHGMNMIPYTSAPPMGDFTPFASTLAFTHLMGVKKEEETPMNFASVAAQGLAPNSSSYSESVTSSLSVSRAEGDQSKVVGFNAPRSTSSPQVNVDNAELLQNRTPGFRPGQGQYNPLMSMPHPGTPPQAAGFMPPSQQQQQQQQAYFPNPAFMSQADMYRFAGSGGFRFGGGGMMQPPPSSGVPEFSRAPGHNKPSSGPPSQNLSPRSSASTPVSVNDQSPRGSLRSSLLARNDEEYSSPHTPMTLPKIESNLNPDARHFMPRHPHAGSMHMGQPPPPIGSGGMQPPVHPAFRPSYPTGPQSAATMGAPTHGGDMSLDLSLLMNNFVGGRASPLLSGKGSHTGMQTQPPSVKDDENVSNGGPSELPRPIGSGRGHKRAHTPGSSYPSEPPHQQLDGLWSNFSDCNDLLTGMTSTTVVTMTTSSLSSVVGEPRPHSQPSFMTSHMSRGGGAGPFDIAGAALLQHYEQDLQPHHQRQMFNASPQASMGSVFSNGGLAGLSPGPPQASPVDGLPGSASLWAQIPSGKLDTAPVSGHSNLSSSDPKLAWPNWSQPSSNA